MTPEFDPTAWRTSSHSGSSQSTCVEVAPAPGRVGIRDSTARHAGHLAVPGHAWRAFVGLVTR